MENVLVQKNENEQLEVTAIIDFTDMHNSYYFIDIAMAACYISLHNVQRCEDGIALLLLGYGGKFTDFDLNIIKVIVAC